MTLAIRANTLLLVLILMTGLVIVGLLATSALGGPLDPPGAPASTDGVRQPGTPISSIPFSASTPGRYYLTRDLTIVGSGTNGVTISASDVTLDLNGFTLRGVAGSIDAVLVSGARTGITIMNGNVRGWFNGIDASNASYSRISNIGALDNGSFSGDGSYGILTGTYSLLDDCRVSNNKSVGIRAVRSIVRGCSVSANGNDGILTVGGTLLQNNQLRRNHQDNGYGDVRFTGADNFASDNNLGSILVDGTSITTTVSIVRNWHCGFSEIGNFAQTDFPGPGDVDGNWTNSCTGSGD